MLTVKRRKGRVARKRQVKSSKEHGDEPISCAHEKGVIQLRKWMKIYGVEKCSLVPYIFPGNYLILLSATGIYGSIIDWSFLILSQS